MNELTILINTLGDTKTTAMVLGVTNQCIKNWVRGDREIPPPVLKLITLLNNNQGLINQL
jgi:DNA-binding transcriptional regulator YiaG